jgi:hypothetical protein
VRMATAVGKGSALRMGNRLRNFKEVGLSAKIDRTTSLKSGLKTAPRPQLQGSCLGPGPRDPNVLETGATPVGLLGRVNRAVWLRRADKAGLLRCALPAVSLGRVNRAVSLRRAELPHPDSPVGRAPETTAAASRILESEGDIPTQDPGYTRRNCRPSGRPTTRKASGRSVGAGW